MVIVAMETEELAGAEEEEEEEGASANKFGGVIISAPMGRVGTCNPPSDEVETWLLVSPLTVLGGDFDVSIILCVCGYLDTWSQAYGRARNNFTD